MGEQGEVAKASWAGELRQQLVTGLDLRAHSHSPTIQLCGFLAASQELSGQD